METYWSRIEEPESEHIAIIIWSSAEADGGKIASVVSGAGWEN